MYAYASALACAPVLIRRGALYLSPLLSLSPTGVCVVLIPVIIDGGGTSGNSVLFNIIFLLSTIPQAASSVYKELAFGDVSLHAGERSECARLPAARA